MSDWKRLTKEVSLESLRPELVSAIREHVERYRLGAILNEALMCIQTESEKAKKGLFGSAETVYQGAVLTPRWLLWAVSGTKTQAAVLSAQLRDVTVQDYAQTQFARLVPDSGIQVSGRFTDVSESSSAFIGLEDNAAGRKFKDAAIQAVQEARK